MARLARVVVRVGPLLERVKDWRQFLAEAVAVKKPSYCAFTRERDGSWRRAHLRIVSSERCTESCGPPSHAAPPNDRRNTYCVPRYQGNQNSRWDVKCADVAAHRLEYNVQVRYVAIVADVPWRHHGSRR